MHPQI
ncbi:hypothetical protein VCHC47A1_1963, partial [Vibrio cholerae HC-47A1]